LNDLFKELKVLGFGTNAESELPLIAAASITAYSKETENADDEGFFISYDLDMHQINPDMDDN
jgi:hypothetical protein